MKKFLSCTKTAIILLVVTIITLGIYAYLLAAPMSYGMAYRTEMEYAGTLFESEMKFYPDKTMVTINTNFEEEFESRYYRQDGYVFYTMALTDEAYEKEVALIKENFEEAVDTPFYASKINAFKIVDEGPDGYTSVYTCKGAIVLSAVFGAVELGLVALTCISWILCKKTKSLK